MDNLPAESPDQDLAPAPLFDRSNPTSLINLLPTAIATAIDEHYFTNPELFDKDERDLAKHLRSVQRTPSPTDHRIRMKFWMEYDNAMALGRPLRAGAIFSNVCHTEYFYKNYLKNPHKVAWMMSLPSGYLTKVEEALEFGIEQLRDILEVPHMDENGKLNSKVAQLKAKIVAMLDMRLKGAPTQKTVSMNINTSNKAVAQAAMGITSEDLRKKLHALELDDRRAAHLPINKETGDNVKPDIEVESS